METMTGMRRCPECGKQQYAIISTVDIYGFPDIVRCRYCGAKFSQADNPIIPWNKGMKDPNAKTSDPEYYRKKAHERYWNDPEYYRMKAREEYRRNIKNHKERSKKYESRPDVKARRAAYAKTDKGKEIRKNWKLANPHVVKRNNIRCHQRALERLSSDPKDPQHGTNTGYGHGCRCDKCKKAHSDKNKAYYRRMKNDKMDASEN